MLDSIFTFRRVSIDVANTSSKAQPFTLSGVPNRPAPVPCAVQLGEDDRDSTQTTLSLGICSNKSERQTAVILDRLIDILQDLHGEMIQRKREQRIRILY